MACLAGTGGRAEVGGVTVLDPVPNTVTTIETTRGVEEAASRTTQRSTIKSLCRAGLGIQVRPVTLLTRVDLPIAAVFVGHTLALIELAGGGIAGERAGGVSTGDAGLVVEVRSITLFASINVPVTALGAGFTEALIELTVGRAGEGAGSVTERDAGLAVEVRAVTLLVGVDDAVATGHGWIACRGVEGAVAVAIERAPRQPLGHAGLTAQIGPVTLFDALLATVTADRVGVILVVVIGPRAVVTATHEGDETA